MTPEQKSIMDVVSEFQKIKPYKDIPLYFGKPYREDNPKYFKKQSELHTMLNEIWRLHRKQIRIRWKIIKTVQTFEEEYIKMEKQTHKLMFCQRLYNGLMNVFELREQKIKNMLGA